MEELIDLNKTKEDVNLMPPLVWAYVGDCVYELYIRTYLVENTKMNAHKLHVEAIGYVKANVLSDEHILRQDMNQPPETKEIIASTQDNEILTIERRKYCNKRFI